MPSSHFDGLCIKLRQIPITVMIQFIPTVFTAEIDFIIDLVQL